MLSGATDVAALDLVWAALVILLAYTVRGVTGFGSALIAVPLLAQRLPLTLVVPGIALLDLLAALALTRAGWRAGHVRWEELAGLIAAAALGIVLGIVLLLHLDPEPLLLALGLLVTGFGLRQWLGPGSTRRVSRWWALPAGVLGGGIGAAFATGGPPFVIYLSHRLHDKAALRASLSAVFLIEGGLRIAGLALAGLLWQDRMALLLLAGLPLMAAGLWLGQRLHRRLAAQRLRRLVGLLLVAAGLSLCVRVWLGGGL